MFVHAIQSIQYYMLFEPELQPDESPLEDVNITTIYLYFSEQEARQFKHLCKVGMMKVYPQDFAERNVNDFLLTILKTLYL